MKRIFIAAIAAVFAVSASHAETKEGKLGARISWDYTNPHFSAKYVSPFTNGSGFSLGAFYDIPVWQDMYFEPGVGIYYDTYGLELTKLEVDGEEQIDGSVRNFGFRIPMFVGYKFHFSEDIAAAVYTGPQINYGLACSQHLPDVSNNIFNGTDETNLYGNGWHRLDVQWSFGLRFHYQDNWIGEVGYSFGINDIIGGEINANHTLRRNTLNIGVGYIF